MPTAFTERLARMDLGESGSFGGIGRSNSKAPTQPIILVHGVTTRAGLFADIRDQLELAGVPKGSVYATTYGDAGKTAMENVTVDCAFSKQVRDLIQAVSEFSSQKVDVIAYSMGVPVSRKAILGGTCVDTKENLGKSLTDSVDTFVSVAGVNRGSFLCSDALTSNPLCNTENGLLCTSAYIEDINARAHYEGAFVFSIFSPDDEYANVNKKCRVTDTELLGNDGTIERCGDHEELIHGSFDLQRQLVVDHKASRQRNGRSNQYFSVLLFSLLILQGTIWL